MLVIEFASAISLGRETARRFAASNNEKRRAHRNIGRNGHGGYREGVFALSSFILCPMESIARTRYW